MKLTLFVEVYRKVTISLGMLRLNNRILQYTKNLFEIVTMRQRHITN